jgi:RNA polymerase subunit RPABC4/transcription elongation factor Spt4
LVSTGRELLIAVLALVLALVGPGIGVARAQDAGASTPGAPGKPAESRFECPSCLAPVAPDADHCPECGLSFKKLEYECPKCKTVIGYDTKVCPNCGLVFDAPAAGTKEKRSATPRDMPPVRDFIKNPDAPEDPDALQVHGFSLSLWRTGKETSFDGRTTITRLAEDLNFEILHIGIPELSFHASALVLSDQSQRPENALTFNLREAYLRYESQDEKTQVNVGRQYITSGVTREFVDSFFLHQMFGDRVGVEVFGGHPVATETMDAGGDLMGGFRVFYRGLLPKSLEHLFGSPNVRDLTIGFSMEEELFDSRTVRQRFGFDVSLSPSWNYDISGHAYYDLITDGLYDARFTFAARPVPGIQITFDYQYVVPSALLPANDLFSIFASDTHHQFEIDVDLFAGDRLKLTALAKLIHVPVQSFRTKITNTPINTGDVDPYQMGAGFSYKHGTAPFKGEFGGQISFMDKGGIERYQGATVKEASMIILRGYEMISYEVAEKHKVKGSVEAQLEAYDGQVYVHQNTAVTLTLTGGYTYNDLYSFTLGGDYRSTPDFTNTGDIFAKVEVRF